MFKFLIIMMILVSSMLIFMKHPLSLGMILLSQTLLVALTTGLMSLNFWFSYILFLVMVGGMLILFIYMTSVASNEKFKFSPSLTISCMLLPMLFTALMFLDSLVFNLNMMSYEMLKETQIINLSMTKYLNLPSNLLMLSIIIYLLITLIMVAKITNIKYGPLRQKF